jgi:hypothetical protein
VRRVTIPYVEAALDPSGPYALHNPIMK